MSLLLDALKRAEQEKSARGAPAPANDAPRPANDAPRPAPSVKPALELQPIAEAARAAAAAKAAEAREAAAALMQAKAPSERQAPSKASIVWAIVGVAIVLIGAGVGYIWYAIQPVRAPATVGERKRPATPPPFAPTASIAPSVQASPTPTPRPPEVARLTPAPLPGAESAAQDTARDNARETSDPQQIMADLLKEAGARAAGPVKFSRSERSASVPPEIRSAYAALAAGDLAAARRDYAAAVSADGSNLDALLGVATVEARRGNRDGARAYYRKVLEIDPRNATALAGLAATAETAAPAALEAQLRAELARAPESAALHVTLGGLYAAQSRWNEAQAEFFDAYRLEPRSADIAFNLAVSLDHLGQTRLAAQYYTRALEAAAGQAPQFEAAAARRRLAELGL